MRRRLALLSLVLILVVVAASGCGKTGSSDPLDAYKQAGIKTAAAKTSHQIVNVSTNAAGQDIGVATDMVVDLGKNAAAGTCTLNLPGTTGGLSMKAYMVDGQMYMEMPGLDKYVAFPADAGDIYKDIDPNQIAELASDQGKPEIASATFTVNGKQVSGQKVTLLIDTAKLKAIQTAKYQAASPEMQKLMESGIAVFDSLGATIPLTAYIDSDGYLARMEMDLTVTQNGTQATAKTVVEAFDFGKSVDIQTPTFTKDNTMTLDELMQQSLGTQ